MIKPDNSTEDKLKSISDTVTELLKITGSAFGISGVATAMVFAMGFVVVNTSLLRHGAFELSLMRTEALAAGISFLIITVAVIALGSVAINPLAEWLEDRLKESHRIITFLLIIGVWFMLLLMLHLALSVLDWSSVWWNTWGSVVGWYFVLIAGSATVIRPFVHYLSSRLQISHLKVYALILLAGGLLSIMVWIAVLQSEAGKEWLQNYGISLILGLPIVFLGGLALDSFVTAIENRFGCSSDQAEGAIDDQVPSGRIGGHLWLAYAIILIAGLMFLWAIFGFVRFFPTGAIFLESFGNVLIWAYIVALFGGLYLEYLKKTDFWDKITKPIKGGSAFPEAGKQILYGIILLLVTMIGYGNYVYPRLPKSMGGGSPVFVEFFVQDDAKEMLQTLGLRVGKDGLTERVEFLTASPERIFVVSQRDETMSFESNLVKALKFYTVNYYVSADAHFTTGEWYFREAQWDIAIQEYSKAILIQADMVDAWKSRGVAYLEKYALSPEDNILYNNSLNDLTKTLELLEGDQVDARFAYTHYERGRLHFLKAVQLKKEGASDESDNKLDESLSDLKEAFDMEPLLIENALLEPIFKDSILESDNEFRMKLGDPEGSVIVKRYASLATTSFDEGRLDESSYAYEMAATLASDILTNKTDSALYHSKRASVLEAQSEFDEALDEWKEAVDLDGTKPGYHHGFAMLLYRRGYKEEAHSECQQELIDPFIEENVAFSREIAACYILIGNIARDGDPNDDSATQAYEEAARLSKQNGLFTTEASAYFERARLQARRQNFDEALNYLERAAWLDRSFGELAGREPDFDLFRDQNGFRQAISPPIILKVMSSEEDRKITIVIQEPVDDFLIRLESLSRIRDFPVLVAQEGGGLAQSSTLSEDGLTYVFQLPEDTSYRVGELAEILRRFLRLSE